MSLLNLTQSCGTEKNTMRLQTTQSSSMDLPGLKLNGNSCCARTLSRANKTVKRGAKQPTAAHKAIAWLVAQGFVKVIITTNFDRLLEKALEEVGVEPAVLSSEDQVKGMVPLVHTQHCLIKLHGDYLDPRIRNTPSELSEYSLEFNQLLDRIFDEFGLIVMRLVSGLGCRPARCYVTRPIPTFHYLLGSAWPN